MKQVCLIKKRILFFMRVLFRKIRCPFICFCKPSSHICTSGALKPESSPHVAPATTVGSVSDDHHVYAEGVGDEEERVVVDGKNQQQQEGEGEREGEEEAGENCVKSSLKKEALDSQEVEKKKVQWMDYLGKELVEIRDFEASEMEDTDNESEFRKGCVCTIL